VDPISARLWARMPDRIDLSLERMLALCSALGDPQTRLPPVVHVAGTNGKGSTIANLRAMTEAAGLRTHVYTSPHLVRFNERIRLAGRLVDTDRLTAAIDRVEALPDIDATVFERTTAAGFLLMAEEPADIALIEVGMGGRLDATNVIDRPLLSVITPVDVDHAEFLGSTIAAIAAEKAGILKPGVRAVIGRQSEEAEFAIAARARAIGTPLSVMGIDFDAWGERDGMVLQTADRLLDLPGPALLGPHQIDNAGLAAAVAVELDLPDRAISEGLRRAVWPARMQRLTQGPHGRAATAAGAELWLDGGHNPHAARALAELLQERQRIAPRPLALIVAMMEKKDHGGFFEALKDTGPHVFTVTFEGKAADPEALAAVARGHGLGAQSAPSVVEALDRALRLGAGRVVICGSLYLAGEVLEADPSTWPT
jgi:dihydrofolate synthase/folylpolyglutamate synthase